MTKGKHDPVFNKGFDEDVLLGYKNAWVPHKGQQLMTRYVVKESAADNKKRKNDLIQDMIHLLKDHEPTNISYYVDEKIVTTIVKVLNHNKIVFSRFTIRDYYDTLCSRKYTESFVKSMIKYLEPRT